MKFMLWILSSFIISIIFLIIIVANPMIWLAEATNNIVQGGENDPN